MKSIKQSPLYSKPHITLVNYMQYEMIEERIINHLNRLPWVFSQ